MPLRAIPFATTSQRPAADESNATARIVNMYAAPVEGLPKSAMMLRSHAGLKETATLGGPIYAVETINSRCFAYASGVLYEIDAEGAATELAGFGAPTDRASIAGNGRQLLVSDGADAWVYSLEDGSLHQIPRDAPNGVSSVAYLDGYGLLTEADTGRFFWTALGDFSAVDGLDFVTAESRPDPVTRLFVDHGEVWLFGPDSIEVFENVGGDPTFQRVPHARFEMGIRAPETVARHSSFVFWVGENNRVYRAVGYEPVPLPYGAVCDALATADHAQLSGYIFEDRGRMFYAIRFPDRPAWVLDLETLLWSERAWGIDLEAFPGSCSARLRASWFIGGQDGTLYTLERGHWQDGGKHLVRFATSAPFHADGNEIVLDGVDFDVMVGQGDFQDREPELRIAWSEDGGFEWVPEYRRELGRAAQRRQRVEFFGLGQFRERCFSFRFTDPTDFSFYTAQARFEVVSG